MWLPIATPRSSHFSSVVGVPLSALHPPSRGKPMRQNEREREREGGGCATSLLVPPPPVTAEPFPQPPAENIASLVCRGVCQNVVEHVFGCWWREGCSLTASVMIPSAIARASTLLAVVPPAWSGHVAAWTTASEILHVFPKRALAQALRTRSSCHDAEVGHFAPGGPDRELFRGKAP